MAKPKCERYWPEVNQTMKIGAIQVTTVSGEIEGQGGGGRGEERGRERERERERGREGGREGGLPNQLLSYFSLQLNEQNISNDFVIRDFMAECQGVRS